MEGGVNPAGLPVHKGRQGVEVGILELCQPSVGEDSRRQLVVGSQLLEHLLVGGVSGLRLLDDRKFELFE